MRETWDHYFAAERRIARTAEAAGIPRQRAKEIGRDLACRPMPRALLASANPAKLLLAAMKRLRRIP